MKTPEFVLGILRSIDTVAVRNGVLEVTFNDGATYGDEREVMTIEEFEQGSFTREVLELIEKHLLQEEAPP